MKDKQPHLGLQMMPGADIRPKSEKGESIAKVQDILPPTHDLAESSKIFKTKLSKLQTVIDKLSTKISDNESKKNPTNPDSSKIFKLTCIAFKNNYNQLITKLDAFAELLSVSDKTKDQLEQEAAKLVSSVESAKNISKILIKNALTLQSSLTTNEINNLTEDMSFDEIISLTDFLSTAQEVKVLSKNATAGGMAQVRQGKIDESIPDQPKPPTPIYLFADNETDFQKKTRAFRPDSSTFHRGYSVKLRKNIGIKYVRSDPYEYEFVKNGEADLSIPTGSREALAHAQIDATGIIQIYDQLKLGPSKDAVQGTFLVLEYRDEATSPTLAQLLENKDNTITQEKLNDKVIFGPSRILKFLNTLSPALTKMESEEVYNLDIKPSNIFISDEQGDALLDNGASNKVFGKSASTGTRGYISPERQGVPAPLAQTKVPEDGVTQLENGQPQTEAEVKVDIRTDLYSLGVVLYEMMTGEPLFPKDPIQSMTKFIKLTQPGSFAQDPLLNKYCTQYNLSIKNMSEFFSSLITYFDTRVNTVKDFNALAQTALTPVSN